MEPRMLVEKFKTMGARVKFGPIVLPRFSRVVAPRVTLDVNSDRRGEFFDVRVRGDCRLDLEVLDLRPELRHLLLLDRDGKVKHRYLCGHDERHWFVAAIPESAAVGRVESAFRALQPPAVREKLAAVGVRRDRRFTRRNRAFVRQGEWFFVPEPGLEPSPALVLRNEPLSRGTLSKPHRMEFAFRRGGHRVFVCRRHPAGLLEDEYRRLLDRDRTARAWGWRLMIRDPEVYATGRVRHPDHATIRLAGWHRVYMNTEDMSAARKQVVFLD